MKTETLADKQNSGTLDAYAWPGGYPIFYLVADNGVLCPNCANTEAPKGLDADCPDDDQWRVVAHDIHWEGEPITCDHCYGEIESAYGPIDD